MAPGENGEGNPSGILKIAVDMEVNSKLPKKSFSEQLESEPSEPLLEESIDPLRTETVKNVPIGKSIRNIFTQKNKNLTK